MRMEIHSLPDRKPLLSAPFHKYDNVLFAVFAPSLLCSLWEGTDLPRKSRYRIVLTKQEREELERRANKYTLPYFIVARAKMILLAAQGLAHAPRDRQPLSKTVLRKTPGRPGSLSTIRPPP